MVSDPTNARREAVRKAQQEAADRRREVERVIAVRADRGALCVECPDPGLCMAQAECWAGASC